MQSNGCGSNRRCFAGAFGLLRLVGDTFTSIRARSVRLPSSFKTLEDSSIFLRNSLSSLRRSVVAIPSADVKEEDSRCRSLIPRVLITSGVPGVGNRPVADFDNFSKGWLSKSRGAFPSDEQ